GYGYSEEYPVARAYRDSRINRIFEGTNEINRLLTMDMLLKRAMKGELDLMTPAFAIQKELMSVPDFGSDEEGMFAQEIKAVRNMKKAFLLVAGAAVQKLMIQLKDEQEILMAASDVLMEIFAAESMLLRIMKLQNRKSETEMAVYKDMMQVFINDSLDRVHRSGTTAINSFATADDQKMMLLGLKRFTKYPSINTTASRRRIADVIIAANAYCF
nr:acyl-CoA dehydrogenase [Chitinophagales bacterium]